MFGDSFRYLDNVGEFSPEACTPSDTRWSCSRRCWRWVGWSWSRRFSTLRAGSAVAIYALALRHGARRWLAAVAAAPLLLDAYELQIEQMIMADAWQQVLLVGLLWVLIGRGAPNPRRAALGGLLLGVALAFRLIAGALVIPALCT